MTNLKPSEGKGVFGGKCNRTACQKPSSAIYIIITAHVNIIVNIVHTQSTVAIVRKLWNTTITIYVL